jgi:DNA polymerase-3 subunit delta
VVERSLLIVGDEEFLVARAISAAIKGAREADPEVEINETTGSELHDGDIVSAASPSMFGGLRVLVVRNAQDVSDAMRDQLVGLIKEGLDDLRLVIAHAGGVKGKKALEALKATKIDALAAAKVSKRGELLQFINGEIAGAGRRISDDGRVALLEAIGPDLRELSAACAQLVADTSGAIDGDVIARFHRGRAETKGYEVAEAALNGDLAGAMGLLAAGMETGLAPVLVTASVAGSLRELIQVHAAVEMGSRNVPGMPPWKADKLSKTARGWSQAGLRRAVLAVAEADASVKGAGTDTTQALHSMFIEIRRAKAGAA